MYSDIKTCHYTPGGVQTISNLGGFVAGPSPAVVRLVLPKEHEPTDEDHSWDSLGKTQEVYIYSKLGEEGSRRFNEFFVWLRETIVSHGGG
jgi:hypothetical protein